MEQPVEAGPVFRNSCELFAFPVVKIEKEGKALSGCFYFNNMITYLTGFVSP